MYTSTTAIRRSWTEAPTPAEIGQRVLVDSWGAGTGARLCDVGRVGNITKINRTRLTVTFDRPLDGGATTANISGDCLRPTSL
jgi:hypothetical protein